MLSVVTIADASLAVGGAVPVVTGVVVVRSPGALDADVALDGEGDAVPAAVPGPVSVGEGGRALEDVLGVSLPVSSMKFEGWNDANEQSSCSCVPAALIAPLGSPGVSPMAGRVAASA